MRTRLYRSRSQRMLLGVCGGVAEYFDVDPTVVRLAAVVLGLFDGLGLLAYIALAVILPTDESSDVHKKSDTVPKGTAATTAAALERTIDGLERAVLDVGEAVEQAAERLEDAVASKSPPSRHRRSGRTSPWVGVALVVGGLWLLARSLNWLDNPAWQITWAIGRSSQFFLPLGLIALGVALMIAQRKRRHD